MSYINDAHRAAMRHGINPHLFAKQMGAEAHGADLTSPVGAQGPAQIMPATAKAWGVRNVHNRAEAYDAAARHMASYLHSYGGSWAKALTAYNAGPGAVGGHLPAETQNYISTILGGQPDHVQSAPAGGMGVAGTPPRLTPGSTTEDHKGAMLAALLDPRKGMSLLDRFKSQMSSGDFTTTTPPSVTPGRVTTYGLTPAGGRPRLTAVEQRANAIDARHLPYKWGGGHGDGGGGPLDCSGAVSKVLGINPRVAAQFKTWGKAGQGRDMTVWASSGHVLLEVAGHFWGTSASNPGGGAGWIPRSQISPSYLSRFTPRHPG